MDLAIYISELLGFKGEVNVPGLGHFAQKRVSGYYNEGEGKFYPPSHEVSFSPTATDDTGLATYITLKKNISQASAKYFIEKYVTGVKQQASAGRADIPGIGYLYYEYAALTFKPDATLGTDPALYGLKPIRADRVSKTLAAKETQPLAPKIPPIVEENALADEVPVVPGELTAPEEEIADIPPTVIPGDELTEEEEEYTISDEDTGGKSVPWVVVLTIVIIALLALTGIYLYDPTLIGLKRRTDTTTVLLRHGPPPVTTADSAAKKGVSPKTSAAQTIQPAVDTFAVKHYDVSGGSFSSLFYFNKALKNYASLGLHPKIAKQTDNQKHLILLATLFNYNDAKRTRDSIKNIKGVNKNNIFIQTYNPKK